MKPATGECLFLWTILRINGLGYTVNTSQFKLMKRKTTFSILWNEPYFSKNTLQPQLFRRLELLNTPVTIYRICILNICMGFEIESWQPERKESFYAPVFHLPANMKPSSVLWWEKRKHITILKDLAQILLQQHRMVQVMFNLKKEHRNLFWKWREGSFTSSGPQDSTAEIMVFSDFKIGSSCSMDATPFKSLDMEIPVPTGTSSMPVSWEHGRWHGLIGCKSFKVCNLLRGLCERSSRGTGGSRFVRSRNMSP